MFRRGGAISRSLHAPHGVNINGVPKNPRLKRKLSWSSPKVRNAASEGGLTRSKPVVLKEGFLYKPVFWRIGGRKRRWCVLRTYTQSEASIDIYTDETKTRFKGTISLDKDIGPILVVKNYDSKKKKTPKNVYLSLKIGKHTCQFTTDSFRELKEWSALIRQAINNGNIYSGNVTEPLNIEDGMVNVKFNSSCISLLCPIKEVPIKTWRLNHITSFGQCGGILTFECCSTCSDPATSRCSINVVQEKPSIILNLMEKAIRSNPNTSEIHYERSILGDIYHCDHDCTQPQRMLPAYSDPNIFRSSSASPQKLFKGISVNIDVHPDIYSTMASNKSNDSGLPGTPQQPDALSISSNIPSPTGSNNSHGIKTDKFSPRHGSPQKHRSMSDTVATRPPCGEAMIDYARRQSEDGQMLSNSGSFNRQSSDGQIRNRDSRQPLYADIVPRLTPKQTKDENIVNYTTIQLPKSTSPTANRMSCNKLDPVNENDGIYDIPECEPHYWNPYSPPTTPNGLPRRENSITSRKVSAQSTTSLYTPGTDIQEREEDFEELPPIPSHRRQRPPVKEMVKLNGMKGGRQRLHSTGAVLEDISGRNLSTNLRGSVDNLDYNRRYRSRAQSIGTGLEGRSGDILAKLHEEEDMLNKVIAASKNERNDELGDVRQHELIRPYRSFNPELEYSPDDEDHLYDSPMNITDKNDRVMTKVAADSVRGYAYKIQIPLSNSEYDVPRRAAPTPDLSNLRSDAPPKPLRHAVE